jgi:hypothetical protein
VPTIMMILVAIYLSHCALCGKRATTMERRRMKAAGPIGPKPASYGCDGVPPVV